MAKTITQKMGSRAVIDTNILIYCSKGRLDFEELVSPYNEIFISSISFMEALGYKYPNLMEKRTMEFIVNSCKVVHTDNAISQYVITYRRIKNIELADAIILATARKMEANLITINAVDFKNLDSSVKIIVPSLI